ncbi:GtrA family protein [Companilactobacillus mishanensis]|uniref:GtrA family protein n=1 Tax=Companilactobacillus mishanensis TaxID=2486008 RepID=UPI001294D86F|nr:GtrA family protein [Companilactobacillus mishanensis]MQS89855.1 GtrA family protein [Companilactobacillus mishanensis]
MENNTHKENSTLTQVVDDVAAGINDAAPTFTTEEELEPEGNGKQAVRYLLWGIISVIVNFGTFFLLFKAFHLNYQFANIVAWLLSVQTGFWIDRVIVFHHKSNTAFREMMAFYATRIITYLIETAALWIGISLLSADGGVTKVFGQILAIIGNYIFSKFFIFRSKTVAK